MTILIFPLHTIPKYDHGRLLKIQRFYDTEIIIKTRPKNVLESNGECSEGSEGYRDQASASEGGNIIEDLVNSNGKDEDISGYEDSKRYPIRPAVTLVPSQPSQPSLPNPSNEDTFYSCYHKGCDFQTQDEYEYKRHGAAKTCKESIVISL